jgi:CheY-like chemotaxis protein
VSEAARVSESAAVLVIAADPNIEALAAELVAFAGYRPLFDVTSGAGGESVRRTRPDVALLDTALPRDVVRACITAASESGSRVVLMSSTDSAAELESDAHAEHCFHFVLPGGPRQLSGVLEVALDRRSEPAPVRVPLPSRAVRDGAVHPALCAAIANVAQARILGARANTARSDAQHTRGVRSEVMQETQRSRAALRAAVADYTTQLRAAHMAQDDALARVQDSIAECAAMMGARAEIDSLLVDAEHWVASVYKAA